MVTSVAEAFEQFRRNLQITTLQTSTVASRQTAVRDAVAAKIDVKESFLTGSYSRNTMIAPLEKADVDVFMVLNPSYYESNGQLLLLNQVRDVLKERYPKTPSISANGQAVTIRFDDFVVDVVPAFYRNGGGYLIPDSRRGKWIATDPRRHVELSTHANSSHDGKLVPLTKMVKAWNRQSGSLFHSFHLEVLLWSVLNGIAITDYPSGVRYFLEKAPTLIPVQNADPAGYGGDVGSYIVGQEAIDTVVSVLNRGCQQARNAEAEASHPTMAIGIWRDFFGGLFPAYG